MDKRLRDDPRVLRMARALRNALLTGSNENSNVTQAASVALVCGALYVLWSYADSHIREDDTLGVGVDEINELVGIDRFSEIMPPEWLEVVDSTSVKLPGYQSHNGASEKVRTSNAVRQARFRHKQSLRNGESNALLRDATVTSNDAISSLTVSTLKTQSATSRTSPKTRKRSSKTQLPEDFSLDPELAQYAVERLPEVDTAALLESFRGKAKAKGWEFSNWRQAFQEFVRNCSPNSGHWAAGQYPHRQNSNVVAIMR